jgi:hypothetical protein
MVVVGSPMRGAGSGWGLKKRLPKANTEVRAASATRWS